MPASNTELLELPIHVSPPAWGDVEASARHARIVGTLDRLHASLGSRGRALTSAGHIRLEHARELVTLLGTGDRIDQTFAGRRHRTRTSIRLPRLTLAIAVAEECGAARCVGNRLVAGDSWLDEAPVAQASAALSALIDVGPMRASRPDAEPFFADRNAVLDGSLVNWLATLLPDGREQRVDHFVNWAVDDCLVQMADRPYDPGADLGGWVARGLGDLFDALEWAGAIEWSGRERQCDESVGRSWSTDGTVRLTALGRHVLPDHLAAAGLKLPETNDMVTAPATGLLGRVLTTEDDEERRALVAGWRPDLDDAERARLVVATLLDAPNGAIRWSGFEVLEQIGPEIAAPYVRELLDSPSAENAAAFLVTHGLGTREQMPQSLGLGPLIDVLAMMVNQPDSIAKWFVRLLEEAEDPRLLLVAIALYETPEATMLLNAAARHVTDPRYRDLIIEVAEAHRLLMTEGDVPDDRPDR